MPSRTLASAAIRRTACRPASASAPPAARLLRSPSCRPATAIRLQVSVPVLSTHSTVVVPSASMAWGWRVSTLTFASLQAPRASMTVQTTANSSGTSDIASVRPTRAPAVQEPSRQTNAPVARMQTEMPSTATRPASRVSSSCRRLARGVMLDSEPPMRPSAVAAPVAVTSATPSPCTIKVPAKSVSQPAAEPSDTSSFATGTDSPVSSDSSARTPCASTRLASQASRSPSLSKSRSPTTRSWLEIRWITPSRTTALRGLDRACRASSTCWVRSSWYTAMPTTAASDSAMAKASNRLPSRPYKAAQTMSSSTIGCDTAASTAVAKVACLAAGRTLGPSRRSRARASPSVRP